MSTTDRHDKSNGQGQGMNWCRPVKRIAIYLRDGMACAYCGKGIEEGIKLTLDHIVPHALNGSNHESNLVTACLTCNSARGKRSVEEFAASVAGYLNHGLTAEDILGHIATTIARPLDKAYAKELMARRGNFSEAMSALRQARSLDEEATANN